MFFCESILTDVATSCGLPQEEVRCSSLAELLTPLCCCVSSESVSSESVSSESVSSESVSSESDYLMAALR